MPEKKTLMQRKAEKGEVKAPPSRPLIGQTPLGKTPVRVPGPRVLDPNSAAPLVKGKPVPAASSPEGRRAADPYFQRSPQARKEQGETIEKGMRSPLLPTAAEYYKEKLSKKKKR